MARCSRRHHGLLSAAEPAARTRSPWHAPDRRDPSRMMPRPSERIYIRHVLPTGNCLLQVIHLGRQSRSNRSLPIVSPKREYSGTLPEIFGDFHPKSGKSGVQRRYQIRELPGFPGYSRVSLRAWTNARLLGWRRSADRTGLQANSLLTGNFTGKFAISGLRDAPLKPKVAVLQRLLGQFPTGVNRENILKNREGLVGIREFNCYSHADTRTNVSVHFSHACFFAL